MTTATTPARTRRSLTLDDLRGDPRRMRKERIVGWVLRGAAGLSIVISVLIVLSLLGEAVSFLQQVDLATLTGISWFPRRGAFDVGTLVVGTLLVTIVAMVVATPLGLGAAIYLSEYAPARVRRFLKPALGILAGIPSVVVGFFALTYLSPQIVQRIWSDSAQYNIAAAGIGVPFTALPMIVFGWARQPSPEFRELPSAAIIVLLAVLLTANAAAILLRNRYERKR